MTEKQKQCLLAYLGYYEGTIDGIWGDQSRAATEAFQRDYQLTADGIFGEETARRAREVIYNQEAPAVQEGADNDASGTGTFWDEIEFFTPGEFACKCGCGTGEIQESLVRAADEIRRRLGVPVTVTSGLRCEKHNAAVGGVSNSRHLGGDAADLISSAGPARMKEVAEEVMGNTGGIGLYSWGIHVDTRAVRARWTG